jgi:hypothetical protein
MSVPCASRHLIHILRHLIHGNFVCLTNIFKIQIYHLKITILTLGRICEYVHAVTREEVSNSIQELTLLDKLVLSRVLYLKRTLLVEMK